MLYSLLKWAALLGGLLDGIHAYRRRNRPRLLEAAQILKDIWTNEAMQRQLYSDALMLGESYSKVTWDRQGSVSHGQVAVIPIAAGEPIAYHDPPQPVWRDVPPIPDWMFYDEKPPHRRRRPRESIRSFLAGR